MAKSQLTFRKKENQKKKSLRKQEKMERRALKKLDNDKGKSLEELYMYVDINGNLSSTPPSEPYKFKIEHLERSLDSDNDTRTGMVAFYNEIGRYGFILDIETRESVYFNDELAGMVLETNQQVKFKASRSKKGLQITEVSIF